MKEIRICLPDHIWEILKLSAMEEGQKLPTFAREGLLGYCRSMGYLSIYDEINKGLRGTNKQI